MDFTEAVDDGGNHNAVLIVDYGWFSGVLFQLEDGSFILAAVEWQFLDNNVYFLVPPQQTHVNGFVAGAFQIQTTTFLTFYGYQEPLPIQPFFDNGPGAILGARVPEREGGVRGFGLHGGSGDGGFGLHGGSGSEHWPPGRGRGVVHGPRRGRGGDVLGSGRGRGGSVHGPGQGRGGSVHEPGRGRGSVHGPGRGRGGSVRGRGRGDGDVLESVRGRSRSVRRDRSGMHGPRRGGGGDVREPGRGHGGSVHEPGLGRGSVHGPGQGRGGSVHEPGRGRGSVHGPGRGRTYADIARISPCGRGRGDASPRVLTVPGSEFPRPSLRPTAQSRPVTVEMQRPMQPLLNDAISPPSSPSPPPNPLGPPQVVYQCSLCNKQDVQHKIVSHRKSRHYNTPKSRCSVCGETFSCDDAFEKHTCIPIEP